MLKAVPHEANVIGYKGTSLKYHGTPMLAGTYSEITQTSNGTMSMTDSKGSQLSVGQIPGSGTAFVNMFTPVLQYVRYRRRHPGDVIISGVWCGKDVSPADSALAACQNFFCVLDLRVGGMWLPLFDFKDAANHGSRIFNIYDFPFQVLDLDLKDMVDSEDAVNKWTKTVCDACPVAAFFGEQGAGCGVVWRCLDLLDHGVWFQSSKQVDAPDATNETGDVTGDGDGDGDVTTGAANDDSIDTSEPPVENASETADDSANVADDNAKVHQSTANVKATKRKARS